MPRLLPFLADRSLGRPLLLSPEKAAVILDVLSGRINIERPEQDLEAAASDQPALSRFAGRDAEDRGQYRVEDGAAIIPIIGSLVNRGAWLGASSGLVSYEGIAAQIQLALDNPDVDRIVLDIDSSGGEAGGIAQLSAAVRAASQEKPVTALVNDMAASAAYWLASAADKIIVSPTSAVGSIGVLWVHVDNSQALAESGRKVTLIHAGAHKVDGNPFEPLPQSAQDNIQGEIDALYDIFVTAVSENRGITDEVIRATEARIYTGQAAIDAGLADEMGGLTQALAQHKKQAKARFITGFQLAKGTPMSDDNAASAVAEAAPAKMVAQADHEAAVAQARAAGAADAKGRIKEILTSAAAEGRAKQAAAFAFDSDMPAADAVKLLEAGAKDSPAISMADRIAADGAANAVEPDAEVVTAGPKINPGAIYGKRRG